MVEIKSKQKQFWQLDNRMQLQSSKVTVIYSNSTNSTKEQYNEMELVNMNWQSAWLENSRLQLGDQSTWNAAGLLGDNGQVFYCWLEEFRQTLLSILQETDE